MNDLNPQKGEFINWRSLYSPEWQLRVFIFRMTWLRSSKDYWFLVVCHTDMAVARSDMGIKINSSVHKTHNNGSLLR
jgi:hypothetical protein